MVGCYASRSVAAPLTAIIDEFAYCRRLKYIAMKPSRLYCATCDETYSLPQNGTIKLFMEKTCPLDGKLRI